MWRNLDRLNHEESFAEKVDEKLSTLRDAAAPGAEELDKHQVVSLLEKTADGIDLLFFAYAMAENQHRTPDEAYEDLREYWGKFAKTFIRDRSKVSVS